MPDFDAILFDFDGVLVDSEPVHYACWRDALSEIGVTLSWDFFLERCIGLDDRSMMALVAAQSDPPRDFEELWARHPVKREMFRARMLGNPPFAPGLAELLGGLRRARYKLALVSSSSRSEVEPVLAAGGLVPCFDVMVCGSDAGALKPAPEPYLLAAKLLGAARPLAVEDSEPGIASARAAGFEVVAVPSAAGMPEAVLHALGIPEAPPRCCTLK
jgi:HAD superfamily hydrolase (TIGR01509 family)